jgi:hypothetical protein
MTHREIQDALRLKLAELVVCTTGAITLSATTTGYVRTTGSFLTDGFAAGMEVTPSGFTSNPVDTIQSVTALTMTMVTARTAQATGAGRTLSVSLPSRMALENETLEPEPLHPYLEEQYLPGPSTNPTFGGPNSLVVLEPMYAPRIFVPRNTGKDAASRYADAMLALFCPKTPITLPTGTASDALAVRGGPNEPGPFRSQLLMNAKGTHATIAATVPLRCLTTNPL